MAGKPTASTTAAFLWGWVALDLAAAMSAAAAAAARSVREAVLVVTGAGAAGKVVILIVSCTTVVGEAAVAEGGSGALFFSADPALGTGARAGANAVALGVGGDVGREEDGVISWELLGEADAMV